MPKETPLKTSIKAYPELRGEHIHVRIFVGPDEEHRGLAGTLVFREAEWDAFADALTEHGFEVDWNDST